MRKSQQVFCATLFSQKAADSFRLDSRAWLERHHFHKKEFTIGSAKDADLIIPKKTIAPLHLKVIFADNQIFIQKTDEGFETSVSGTPIHGTSPFPYKSGEVILFGDSDKALYIEIFHQEIKPSEQRDEIIKEAVASAEAIKKQADVKLTEAMTAGSWASQIIAAAKNEAAEIVALARRQYEENIRAAIEESKSRSEDVSTQLIQSGKNEVEILLNEAKTKADKIADEGILRKNIALQEEVSLKNKIEELRASINHLQEEKLQVTSTFEEAAVKKSDLELCVGNLQKEYEQTSLELVKSKAEFATTQSELDRCLNEVMRSKQDLQKTAEDKMLNEKLSLELTERNEILAKDVAELKEVLGRLRETEQKEIEQIQQRAELEYDRQKKLEHARMSDRIEHENKMRSLRKIQEEKIESERREAQIEQISHDVFQQLTTRFGFRSDDQNMIRTVISKSINDEYYFRQTIVSQFEIQKVNKTNRFKLWTSAAVILLFLGIGTLMTWSHYF